MIKKLLKIPIIFCLLLLFVYKDVYAYDDNIQFNSITTIDGLSQSTAESIYQDSKGYIWIGTNDGLNRYDGYNFKVYKYGKDSKTSIASNYIFSIKEDLDGNIWVGTISGVSKISNKDNTITNYYEGKDNGNLSSNNGADILVTDDGRVLVGTENGLNLYNPKTDSFDRILDDEDTLTCQDIYSLAQDENKDIWIGTYFGLNKIDVSEKTIQKFYSTEDENSISENCIYKVYSDRNGYVWVGTESKGLNKININTNEITVYQNVEGDETSLQGGYVTNILRDKSGAIWVCTDEGLSKYIEESDSFITYQNKLYDRYSLLNNQTFGILEDNNGLIWVGTYSGINIFDPNNKVEHYKNSIDNDKSLNDNVIHGLYEDNDGYLWGGTKSGGINIISRNNRDVIKVIDQEDGLSDSSINFIVGEDDYVWVATRNGLNRIDKQDYSIKKYSEDNGLLNNNIKVLMLDSKGYLWIGSPSGVNILDTKTEKIISLNDKFEKYGIEDNYVKSIYELRDGSYLIGTFKQGYTIRLDINKNIINVYRENKEDIGSTTIYAFYEDDNYIWIGTSYGLNRINKETEEYKKYTELDGLCNDNIYSIIADDNNNLWMSTNYGISVLNPKSERFINYSIMDGLQSNEFNAGAYYKNKGGEIMFGGINGFNTFNPKDMKKGNSNTKVVFEEFEVDGKSYTDISNMKLSNNSNLTIKFFFPDYTDTNNTKYFYKIDGIDEKWSLSDGNKIIYRNLNYGEYTFKIRAVDHNGVISDESNFTFYVKPHILFSPIAYIIYTILIIVVIYINRTKVKRLDRLVKNRTIELNNEMNKNKELFDKVIKLERNKNNYFVNLSHELRTPLNVISSTQQLLLEFNKRKNGIERDRLDYHINVMRNNTKRLLNLINNIIDTSKVEHGNYHIDLRDEDIVYIVEEAALDMKDYIEANNIELIIDPHIEEKIIECDRREIERCIINLIDNARKFTPPGGKIEVKIYDLKEKIKITVRDTGSGIDVDNQKYIFDRFNQVIDHSSESKGESGLGLTITKHIIDMHNGEIFVESELNKGSTFTIILPVKVNKI